MHIVCALLSFPAFTQVARLSRRLATLENTHGPALSLSGLPVTAIAENLANQQRFPNYDSSSPTPGAFPITNAPCSASSNQAADSAPSFASSPLHPVSYSADRVAAHLAELGTAGPPCPGEKVTGSPTILMMSPCSAGSAHTPSSHLNHTANAHATLDAAATKSSDTCGLHNISSVSGTHDDSWVAAIPEWPPAVARSTN